MSFFTSSFFLRIEDRIAFALSCQRFRRLCMDERVFRKLDLSRCVISTSQRCAVNRFFRDRQLTQNIKELNVSNLSAFNWRMDYLLQKFIKSICPQLEALHVIDCGVSFQTLHSILKQASRLTALSWSIWDFISKDMEFLSKTMKSSGGICFKNIKHLYLHVNESLPQIQIAKYLVLSCCSDIVELEIYTWQILDEYLPGSFPVAPCNSIPGLNQPSVQNELQHLNSLVVAVRAPYSGACNEQMYDFVVSVLSRKSSSAKWKKFCISPTIDSFSREDFSLLLHSNDFHSVEEFGVNASESPDSFDELKTLFEKIDDKTVKSLQFFLPRNSDSIAEFCNPISRVGGHSLKVLRLSSSFPVIIHAEQNTFIHSLFSNCLNIREHDLLDFCFERDICEPLSQLKHLTKVQLRECAIGSKHSEENQIETSNANLLTFVEDCKNITHLDVRGCVGDYRHFSCLLTDDDLLALVKLRNLKSLTLCLIDGITEWTFLKNISENCKFLTTLRITDWKHFNSSHIPILMESVKFLKHLVICMNEPILQSEVFWNLLRHAKNLEILCIGTFMTSLSIPLVAVETLKSLPRLHVLHLHDDIQKDGVFHRQMIRMLKEKEYVCRFSFEIVTGIKRNTWINHPTGYTLISNKALAFNEFEMCNMTPIVEIPRF